ncbi:ATP-binding cassette domain-containing protein [Granulicella sp. WH15]|uniref:ABC transporter ATP-binding protein n=1 Tax=Granulicella sp. WH15 TaxID=2602070 RepID=UPI0013670636|nr:ATP-binding cassette domain-containing protein [Granulicella sp. WH15]QHN03609.1 ATP-binding cassette domain-containing protein [Granulicella sp. WH15]
MVEERTAEEQCGKPYLVFDGVSKSFGSNTVLDNVTFEVGRGETVCVMGRSGVGKSVCLELLMGFLKPDSGRVIVAGQDITNISEEQLEQIHKKVTMVFQSGALFDSLTVAENVAFPMRERGCLDESQIQSRVDALLDRVGILELRDFLPDEVSTGLRRAVAIARAIAEDPEAVLYDEPTTMVDPLMVHGIGQVIARLKVEQNLTSVVVTHDTHLAEKLADHIIFLNRGKIQFFGTVEEMKASPDPFVREFLEDDQLIIP